MHIFTANNYENSDNFKISTTHPKKHYLCFMIDNKYEILCFLKGDFKNAFAIRA